MANEWVRGAGGRWEPPSAGRPMDDARAARLAAHDETARSPAIWAVTLRVEDYIALRAAYDALRVERDQTAPVLAAAVELDSCGSGEGERFADAFSALLAAVQAWRTMREV